MAAILAAVALVASVALSICSGVVAEDWSGWSQGRASYYGDDGGASIHGGSCMFGHLDPNKGTGWDVAALSDKNPDYGGSCGRCYEVACRPSQFRDGYGNSVNREGVCNSGKKVIVTITDTCPCNYPSNAYSNTRWCCGDMYHMDLSTQAFGKIGNTGSGVMGIYYRQVPCPGSGSSKGSSSDDSFSYGSSSSSSSSAEASSSSSNSSSGSHASASAEASSSGGGHSSAHASASASSSGGWSSKSESAWPNRGLKVVV